MFRVETGTGVVCTDHPTANVIEDNRTADRICIECGLILGKSVDDEGEWRTFSQGRDKKDQSRVGGPLHPLLTASDLGTTIDTVDGSHSSAEKFLGKDKAKVIRGLDRELINGFSLIEKIATGLSLNKNVRNQAENILKEILEKRNLIKKISTDAMAAASLYVACRQEGTHVLYSSIGELGNVKKLQVTKCFRIICKYLDISVDMVTPENFIEPICTKFGLPGFVMDAALHIARMSVESNLVLGSSPNAVAGAAIYMATQASSQDKRPTRQDIADEAGIHWVTISTTYAKMYVHAEKLFPPKFDFFTPIEELPLK